MRSEKFKGFSGDSSNLSEQIGDVEGCTVFATSLLQSPLFALEPKLHMKEGPGKGKGKSLWIS